MSWNFAKYKFMPLTNTEIKNAQPKEKEFSISDSAGLSFLVKPNGAKLWRFRYSRNGKAQKLSLGTYPDTTLAHLPPKHLEHLLILADTPFRRSAAKDLDTALESVQLLRNGIWEYRYLFTDSRYREHVRMISNHTRCNESFPPSITTLLFTEAKALAADELALIGHGIEPDDYANVSSRSMWNECNTEHLYGFVESLVAMFMHNHQNKSSLLTI